MERDLENMTNVSLNSRLSPPCPVNLYMGERWMPPPDLPNPEMSPTDFLKHSPGQLTAKSKI